MLRILLFILCFFFLSVITLSFKESCNLVHVKRIRPVFDNSGVRFHQSQYDPVIDVLSVSH